MHKHTVMFTIMTGNSQQSELGSHTMSGQHGQAKGRWLTHVSALGRPRSGAGCQLAAPAVMICMQAQQLPQCFAHGKCRHRRRRTIWWRSSNTLHPHTVATKYWEGVAFTTVRSGAGRGSGRPTGGGASRHATCPRACHTGAQLYVKCSPRGNQPYGQWCFASGTKPSTAGA